MTEFEAATLAAQHTATLTALGVGVGQLLVLAGGLFFMWAESRRRGQEHAARHEETMAALQVQGEALRTLIERTAPPSA